MAFEAAENRGILQYLGSPERLDRSVSVAKHRRECAPEDVRDAYLTLGGHPELVERLWDELPRDLPQDCRWVVYGTPALVHPNSGIVFAFGGGTHTYAFRLPPERHREARAAGATTVHDYPAYPKLGIPSSRLDLADIGPEWCFGGWHDGEHNWCLAAYAYAEGAPTGDSPTKRRNCEEMELHLLTKNGRLVAKAQPGQLVLGSPSGINEVLEFCLSHRVLRLLLHSENLPGEFFELRTGLAGAVLQKCRTYRLRIALILAPDLELSGRFHQLIEEENLGPHFRFFNDAEKALAWVAGETPNLPPAIPC